MITDRCGRGRRGSEAGGVLVMVAIFVPVLVVMLSLVIDFGNWFEHRRHLQLQADASALAGANEFRLQGCSNAPILAAAGNYAGPHVQYPTAQYNPQVGGTPSSRIQKLVNSTTYYDGRRSDPTAGTGNPCADSLIDVKLTETDVPWFFRLGSLPFVGAAFGSSSKVPYIDAHARVEIQSVSTRSGALPLGVPDFNAKAAWITLINEANGTEIQTCATSAAGPYTAGCHVRLPSPPTIVGGRARFSSATAVPLYTSVSAAAIGVRVAVSVLPDASTAPPACSATVLCYALPSSNTNGVAYIRGWSSTPVVTTPQARDVQLYNGSCADPYVVNQTTACTIGVKATVDFPAGATNTNSFVRGTIDGSTQDLTYTASGTGYYFAGGAFSIPAAAGPLPVTLSWARVGGTITGLGTCATAAANAWTTNGTKANPCQGSLGAVQRTRSLSPATTEVIQGLQVLNAAAGNSVWANSFALGTSQQLRFNLDVTGNLQNAASTSDPLVTLRVSGNQTQSVDCDPTLSNIRDEIINGCSPAYAINTTGSCPDYNALWSSPQPWHCVKVQTGAASGQIRQGMATRMANATCPNNWSSFPNFPTGDPRIVPVFITPYGSFKGNGNDIFPVSDFAMFYVTGWDGDACRSDDPAPTDSIVGHFVKYVDNLATGSGSACVLTAFGACTAVMTK